MSKPKRNYKDFDCVQKFYTSRAIFVSTLSPFSHPSRKLNGFSNHSVCHGFRLGQYLTIMQLTILLIVSYLKKLLVFLDYQQT